jgi:ABC-type multidrug transport system fused ATPase/permease subunit
MEGKTVIVITHRPSTTELAEKVAVMKDGVVVEEGSLEEMREEGSFYRRLLAT